MRHRAEIDGLRAVSVVPVILFHAGFSTFQGGFVGVDVFFVISGFLITSLIWGDLERGQFSIADFYERRARRILPALFVMMLACLVAAWVWMTPPDMRKFAQTVIAVPLFASNILLSMTSGYFDTSSELKPLLHTWSLAVEEQYYLFFPLLLMWLGRLGKNGLSVVFVALAVASLALAEWGLGVKPDYVFFLLPTRIWELLIGALLAFQLQHAEAAPKLLRQCLSAAGLGLILLATFAFDEYTPFPSVYALVPTVGAALVIGFAGPDTWTGRLLSQRLLVGIGLISYSAYLWHQPLFAFARYTWPELHHSAWMLGLSLMSMVLAYLTWRFVETPMRHRSFMTRQQVFLGSGVICLLFIAVGFAGHRDMVPTRWALHHPGLINRTLPVDKGPTQDCSALTRAIGEASCTMVGHGSRTMVIWGDSHAIALEAGVQALPDTTIYILSHPGCPPLAGVRRFDGFGSSLTCGSFEALQRYTAFVESLHPQTLVMVGRWTLYLRGWHKAAGELQRQHHFLSDGDEAAALGSMDYRIQMLTRHLQDTAARFAPHTKVIVLSQPADYAEVNFQHIQLNDFVGDAERLRAWHQPETAALAPLKATAGVQVLDIKQLFCDPSTCATRRQGTLLYKDDNHLSPFGASLVWGAIAQAVQ
jgi:peptidoglycan/LPS O-acetylase OafA/YrhL